MVIDVVRQVIDVPINAVLSPITIFESPNAVIFNFEYNATPALAGVEIILTLFPMVIVLPGLFQIKTRPQQ